MQAPHSARVHSIAILLIGVFLGSTADARSAASPLHNAFERIQLKANGFVFDALAAGPAEGKLVLLLHGFPQTSFSFRHQLKALAEAGYRAVAPDQRGYSPGARPAAVDDYAMNHLVGDVIAIADALGRESFHLVGHDWGGAVAWVAATRFPHRVLSLTVLSTPHFAAFGAALADPNSEQSKRSAYFQVFGAEGAEERFLANDAALLKSVYEGAGLTEEEVQVYIDALGNKAAMKAALNWYAALSRSRPQQGAGAAASAPPVPPIRVPTLYIWSTGDAAFSRSVAEATRDHVQGPYRFEVLEGVSHWVPEQAAEKVNALLLEHLQEVKSSE